MPHHEEIILESWQINAAAWSDAIQQEIIESRKLITNAAIVDAVLKHQPARILDLGCGEGWLCRAMQANQIETLGIDATPELITQAKQTGKGRYEAYTYQQIVNGEYEPAEKFDVIIFNFSLFGDNLVPELLGKIKSWMTNSGTIIIQTLHPFSAKGDGAYETGWRDGSWEGFPDSFTRPAPWYYRTLQSWLHSFNEAGLVLKTLHEPLHPKTKMPASIIFELGVAH